MLPSLCIFGPPGSGKSTTIRTLGGMTLHNSVQVIDLEDGLRRFGQEWTPASAASLADLILRSPDKHLVIGAAALSLSALKRIFPGCATMLILPEKPIYEVRRRLRDEEFPEKANQTVNYEEWAARAPEYSLVVSNPVGASISWLRERALLPPVRRL